MAGEALFPKSGRCERARQWTSLRLDGELSELEDVLLEKHLAGCGACRSFAVRMRRTTELVRLTPNELPERAFERAAPQVVRFPVGRRLAVAAVAAAIALGSLLGSSLNRPARAPAGPGAPQVSLLTRDLNELRELKTHQPTPIPVNESGNPREGVI